MGSTTGNPNNNPWGQYDSYKDCSQGVCSVYCPQWCYIIFPPPPSFFLEEEDDSSSNDFSPLLSEFQEDERLRLLPKCNHAFHVTCIDTWLKSHSNCPLCRAFITAGETADSVSDSDSDSDSNSVVVNVDLEISRSTDLKPPEVDGSASSVVSIADILREVEDEDVEMAGVGTSRRVEEGEGGEKTRTPLSNYDMVRSSVVAMKRSVSSGKFVLSSYDQSRSYRLPN